MQSGRNVGNDDLNYVSHIYMLLMTGVEISNKPQCAKKPAISKSLKTL